jgi:hypothetical protein
MVRRSTLVLVLIFVALLGSVFYLQHSESQKEALITPTEENPLIFNFTAEIKGISIERVGSGIVELTKNNQGAWSLKSRETEEVDVQAVESAISQLLSSRVVSELGSELALKEAGLDPPVYRVMISLADESKSQMSVGRETPTSSGYYVKVDNSEVYVVSINNLDPILSLVDEPPIVKALNPLYTEEAEPQLLQVPTIVP